MLSYFYALQHLSIDTPEMHIHCQLARTSRLYWLQRISTPRSLYTLLFLVRLPSFRDHYCGYGSIIILINIALFVLIYISLSAFHQNYSAQLLLYSRCLPL